MQQLRFISRLRVSAAAEAEENPHLNSVARADETLERARSLLNLILGTECRFLNLGSHSADKRVRKQLISTASRFSAMFSVLVDESNETWIHLTPELEQLHSDEVEMRREREASSKPVDAIRKLLMMCKEQSILLSKLSMLKTSLMLPEDLETKMVHSYPEFFSLVDGMRGPVLRLSAWDMSLAETAREMGQLYHPGTPRSSFFLLGIEDEQLSSDYRKFQRLFFPLPYEPLPKLKASGMVLEKRAVSVYHELLSLMPFRRCFVPVLDMLRPELQLTRSATETLARHPAIFYTSSAVEPPKVFLKEAFATRWKLKYKGREELIRDRYLKLLQASDDDGFAEF